MYRAITGHKSSGPPEDLDKPGPNGEMGVEAIRNAYWATTFRALGDVIHLVQDMSQPQHTRNELHWANTNNKGHTFFESYTNARALQSGNFVCNNGLPSFQPPPVHYDGYKIPAFGKFTDYFSTRDSDANVKNRRGLADFSNREFFTAGSNLGDSGNPYAYPVNEVNDPIYHWKELDVKVPCLPSGFAGKITLAMKDVEDALDGGYIETYYSDPYSNQTITSRQIPVSTRGMWSTLDDEGFFTTNEEGSAITEYNYTAMADVSIPRAVAYSAGVIDYFFRGRIKIVNVRKDVSTGGTPGYRVTLKNVSEYPVATANVFSEGMFTFYYKALDQSSNSIMQPLAVLEGDNPHLTGGATLQPDATLEFLLAEPAADWDRTQPPSMVAVFNGVIGLEQGIAAYVFSPGGLLVYERSIVDADNRVMPRLLLSEDGGVNWSTPFVNKPADNGINDYFIDVGEYIGGTSIVSFGVSNPLGSPDLHKTVFRSEDLGRTWLTVPDSMPYLTVTKNGSPKLYNFQHREYIGNNTLVALGIPAGTATPPNNEFFSDYTLFISTDLGQSWLTAGGISSMYYPGEIEYTGETSPGVPAYALMAAYQDPVEGTRVGFFRSIDGGQNWVRENNDVFSDSVAHTESNYEGIDGNYHVVYMGNNTYLANYVRYDADGPSGGPEYHNEFYESDDGGNTWNVISEVPKPVDDGGDPLKIGEVKSLHYLGNNRVFAYISYEQFANGYPIYGGYLSTNGGNSWMPTNPGLPFVLDSSTTPNYHRNIYRPFIGAIDNGAIPGRYDVP
jgi:hypothetical protein